MVRRLGMLIVLVSLLLPAQFKSYARTWARDAQHQQEFFDTYFLNYDVNDPYRCDCPIYDYCPSYGCQTVGPCR
jgi:hypothetical protein